MIKIGVSADSYSRTPRLLFYIDNKQCWIGTYSLFTRGNISVGIML